MNTCYIGVDIGNFGGISAVKDNKLIRVEKMPTMLWGKHMEADSMRLIEIISSISPSTDGVCVVVEECSHHQPSSSAMRSQALSFGKIWGALERVGVRRHRFLAQKWQGEILGKCKKGTTKSVAESRFKAIFPDGMKLMDGFGDKHKEGCIDAALLAEYAKRKNL